MFKQSIARAQSGVSSVRKLTALFITAIAFAAISTLSVQSGDAPEVSHDGLHLDTDSKVALLYTKPDADFSVYERFLMLDAYVAFKKNWERDTKVAGRRIPKKDIEKIKVEAAELLYETFREELDEEGGYEFVTEADDNVMIMRPALIDLQITAPDIKSAGRVTQYVASAGSATLYLELYDSVSGEIIARIVDRRNMQDYGYARWANSVTNRADAKRMFKRWADLLRQGMDEQRSEAGLPPIKAK
ncbi:DUF3313 family protein [Halieaceae bacterium IMCC14734]|uniref:DUF3313 family protein n=1 Tax=Candidatus Litorirhabdus singularis TaxID=2518993 RepID=A0ABT3TDA4_9GAMM|nr:DUF3313 family protein [Candidatus Litorirhabdus singularis]MCX2980253.1 DUF3313 family protein [Candidatus Litorirhabdus singularis]